MKKEIGEMKKTKWCRQYGMMCKDKNCPYEHLDEPEGCDAIRNKCQRCNGTGKILGIKPQGLILVNRYHTCPECWGDIDKSFEDVKTEKS